MQAALSRMKGLVRKSLRRRPQYDSAFQRLVQTDTSLWENSLAAAAQGDRVLIATSIGGHEAVTPFSGLIAAALTLRGASPHVLLCDSALPACLDCDSYRYSNVGEFASHGPSALRCSECLAAGLEVFGPLGVHIHRYSEVLSGEDIQAASATASRIPYEAIGTYVHNGIAVGEHALAGALRFFVRGSLEGQPYGEEVLRRYLESALLTESATRNLLAETDFSVAFFHHGIYVPQGIVGEVSRELGVRVVNWAPAYRKGCFLLSHNDTYHHVLIDEPLENWEGIQWNDALEHQIMSYLDTRWAGTHDWISFHNKPESARSDIEQAVGIDFNRPTIALLTNVIWDAQLHYGSNAFPSMLDWLLETIAYFRDRPDVQLLVRVHPGEVMTGLPSKQRAVDEISKAFGALPPNVFVIPPESDVSTYAAVMECDAALVFGTITGVELTSRGIPVIVAGEAWIRNKGITTDVTSREEYFQILDTLPWNRRLEGDDLERARKYAYHFFMRRMIPVPFLVPTGGWPPYRVGAETLGDLLPGKSAGLDIVCNGILSGSKFIYPAETTAEEHSTAA